MEKTKELIQALKQGLDNNIEQKDYDNQLLELGEHLYIMNLTGALDSIFNKIKDKELVFKAYRVYTQWLIEDNVKNGDFFQHHITNINLTKVPIQMLSVSRGEVFFSRARPPLQLSCVFTFNTETDFKASPTNFIFTLTKCNTKEVFTLEDSNKNKLKGKIHELFINIWNKDS